MIWLTQQCVSQINVYRIKDIQSRTERVVHRNLLLAVDFVNLGVDDSHAPCMDPDLSDVTCGTDRDSVNVDRVVGNTRTMDCLMHTPDIENPDDEDDGESLVNSRHGSLPNVTVVDAVPSASNVVHSDSVSVAHSPVLDHVTTAQLNSPDKV